LSSDTPRLPVEADENFEDLCPDTARQENRIAGLIGLSDV
jgi:hypothetical protein